MEAARGLAMPADALVSGRRKFVKGTLGTLLAASALPALTSCDFLHSKSQFVVNAEDWLESLALAIGAKTVYNIVKGGLRGGSWSPWAPEVEDVAEDILEYGLVAAASSFSTITLPSNGAVTASAMTARYRFIPGGVAYAQPVPPVLMMRASRTRAGDPDTDLLVAFVDGGRKHIIFKPWAWQTLALFVNYLTANQDPANLSVARAVCVLTLIPSGTRPQTGTMPGGLADYYNYKSRNGNVRIALIQESNGSPTGVITASAIPGGDGRPLVKSFKLPTQPAIA
jgi:hypothetical protein